MDDLALLREYLMRLRTQRLHVGHTKTLAATPDEFAELKAIAHEAETINRVIGAIDLLIHHRDEFIRSYLQ